MSFADTLKAIPKEFCGRPKQLDFLCFIVLFHLPKDS